MIASICHQQLFYTSYIIPKMLPISSYISSEFHVLIFYHLFLVGLPFNFPKNIPFRPGSPETNVFVFLFFVFFVLTICIIVNLRKCFVPSNLIRKLRDVFVPNNGYIVANGSVFRTSFCRLLTLPLLTCFVAWGFILSFHSPTIDNGRESV